MSARIFDHCLFKFTIGQFKTAVVACSSKKPLEHNNLERLTLGRKSIEVLRRKELTDAAFEVLFETGIRGATLERVARKAGVSKGVLLHYFKDKDAVFETVLRKSNALTGEGVAHLLRRSQSPWERLYAIVLGNFSPVVFQKQLCHAWICLCAEVPYNEKYQRIQTVIHSRMRSNLYSALRTVVVEDQIERVVFNISTLIDGIWLRAGLQTNGMSRTKALQEMLFGLEKILPDDPRTTEERKLAYEKMEMISSIIFEEG
ncbi:transcriptional regulator BetI [Kiloniella sp. b19]|uniref:transcriptional regulator BetI n=1 Tax=Kiloniella sp. GXU_MW_B19 TaxID=3141326 RepID=UPI0031CE7D9B